MLKRSYLRTLRIAACQRTCAAAIRPSINCRSDAVNCLSPNSVMPSFGLKPFGVCGLPVRLRARTRFLAMS